MMGPGARVSVTALRRVGRKLVEGQRDDLRSLRRKMDYVTIE